MKKSKSRIFHILFLAALSFPAPSFADVEEDSFDGSAFNPEPFGDTSFGKHIYGDLPYKRTSDARKYRSDQEEGKVEKDHESGRTIFDKDKARLMHEEEERKYMEESSSDKYGVIPPLVRDWVPDEPDLTSNGGFSIAPFNGTPVPYDLNGHVDIQR